MHALKYRQRSGKQMGFELAPRTILIGRHPGNDLVLTGWSVSRRHCGLFWTRDGFLIEDLGSRSGTWIGTDRITAPTWLTHGDRIMVGAVAMIFTATQDAFDDQADDAFSDLPIGPIIVRQREFRCWWHLSWGSLRIGWSVHQQQENGHESSSNRGIHPTR